MNTHVGRALALMLALASPAVPAWTPVSGTELLSPELRRMQEDEFENPGMLMVDEGRAAFAEPGFNGKSCASCHGEDGEGLDRARIAAYPVWDPETRGPMNLRMRIDRCRQTGMDEFPEPYESRLLLALETFSRYKARGTPVQVSVEGPMKAHYEAGRRLFETRMGQLDLACVLCHETWVGRHLRSQVLTQGQTNAFPAYRLTTGRVTGLHRKFTDCLITLRAEPWPVGSPEYLDLEVYMAARGNGLPIETPGIRR